MKRISVSNFIDKLISQDVNNIMEFDHFGCNFPNDFTDWSTLSSEVTTYQLTPEEIDLYLKGKLEIK